MNQILQKIPKYTQDGYIRASRHPNLPLTIYNYTQKATNDEKWDKVTEFCRGLILDDSEQIIIRGPKKFFNRGEKWAAKFDISKSIISEKLDGYYISIKLDSHYGLIINSRGSFCNKYTTAAEKLITSRIRGQIRENIEYFLELLQNFDEDAGIIVTKHPFPRLVCWAMRESGKEVLPTKENCPFEIARRMTFNEATKYLEINPEGKEGVVVFDLETEERVKIKTDWFLKTHRIIADCTKRRVWEIVSSGGNIKDLELPNEFLNQMLEWEEELKLKVDLEFERLKNLADKYSQLSDKELGLYEMDSYEKSAIFSLRKGRSESVLKMIYMRYKD